MSFHQLERLEKLFLERNKMVGARDEATLLLAFLMRSTLVRK